MNEIEFQKLMETSWRRKLTAEEEFALKIYQAKHSKTNFSLEEESSLNQAFASLSDVPVSTNFTSQILRAINRDTTRVIPDEGIASWFKLNWFPRIGIVSLFVFAGFISVQQYQMAKRSEMARAKIVQDVAMVSGAVPQRWLQDFDAINRLSEPPVDDELLAALQ